MSALHCFWNGAKLTGCPSKKVSWEGVALVLWCWSELRYPPTTKCISGHRSGGACEVNRQVAAFGNSIKSWVEAIVALVLLFIGVGGIAFCDQIAQRLSGEETTETSDLEQTLADGADGIKVSAEPYKLMADVSTEDRAEWAGQSPSGEGRARSSSLFEGGDVPFNDVESSQFVKGMLAALMVGLCGGSILVPMHYVDAAAQGLVFIPSFGIGVLVCGPLVTVVYFLIQSSQGNPGLTEQEWHVREVLPYGLLSGTIWNIGNILSIPSINAIGYSVAYPIMQCALFVAGLWGVFAFHEIQGVARVVFFVSGTVLLGGAALLSVAIGA